MPPREGSTINTMNDHLWERRVFERHGRAELAGWALSLRYFRFCRAYGGHSGDDADELAVAIRAESEAELLQVLAALGIPVLTVPPDAPGPQPGVAYTAAEYGAFPQRIDLLPHIRQPSHVRLAGQRAHAWASGGRLCITIRNEPDPYEVSAASVAAARAVEAGLEPLATSIIDPPKDSPLCVCPKYYPEIWAKSS